VISFSVSPAANSSRPLTAADGPKESVGAAVPAGGSTVPAT
jgi:hypothetical protein